MVGLNSAPELVDMIEELTENEVLHSGALVAITVWSLSWITTKLQSVHVCTFSTCFLIDSFVLAPDYFQYGTWLFANYAWCEIIALLFPKLCKHYECKPKHGVSEEVRILLLVNLAVGSSENATSHTIKKAEEKFDWHLIRLHSKDKGGPSHWEIKYAIVRQHVWVLTREGLLSCMSTQACHG